MRLFSRVINQEINKIHQETGLVKGTLNPVSKITVLRQEVVELSRRLQPLLTRASLFCGGLVLVGGISGAKWGISYVQAELVPQLSEILGQVLDRPIQLGAVEQVSWTGIRLGRSVLPATATDADHLTVEAIEIQFNPLYALKPEQLKLTVTLIQPTAYFDQNAAGEWLDLKLKFDDEEQIEVEQIRIQDATVTLAPQPIQLEAEETNLEKLEKLEKKEADPDDQPWDTSDVPTQMTLHRVNGSLSLQEPDQRLAFEVTAQPHEHGTVRLAGNLQLDTNQLHLALQTQAVQIKAFAPFIPTDIKIEAGTLTTDLNVQVPSNRPPVLSGTAKVRQLAGWAKGEPNPLTGINGDFRFQGQEAILSRGQLRFGQIPFELDGKLHLQRGFDINARVVSVDAAPLMQTLQLEVPFPVNGALKATDLRITGALNQPMLSGTVQAAQPLQFDRLAIAAVHGSFNLALAEDHLWIHEIRLQPVTGGSIAARAEIWLEEDNADIAVTIQNISADRLAQLYQIHLPDRRLGMFNAEAQVTLVNEEPSLTANWSLNQGRYPAQGKVTLSEDVLRLQQTRVQIGNGALNAQAELKQGQWQATFAAAQVPLNQVVATMPGQLQGQWQVTGSAKDFSLNTVQASGQMAVQIAEGTLNAELKAAQGEWQAQVSGSKIPLRHFVANGSGNLQGDVKLQGNLAQLSIAETQAVGTVGLSNGIDLFKHPLMTDFAWNGTKLHIQQLKSENILIDGWIIPTSSSNPINGIAHLDLNVNVQDYDLATLPLTNGTVPVTGRVSLNGKLTGTSNSPEINSDVRLEGLAIQDFQFEPLQGQIQSQPDRQLSLDLKGKQDRIALMLDANYRPATFAVKLGQAEAEGRLNGKRLIAKLENFALEKLNLAVADLGAVRGMLAGNFDIDLANLAEPVVSGSFGISQPGIGRINATPHPNHTQDQLVGKVLYHKGTATLSDAVLQLGNSNYAIVAQITPQLKQWRSQVAITQGTFQDLLTLLSPEDLLMLVQSLTQRPSTDQTHDQTQTDDSPAPPAHPQIASVALTQPTLADLAALEGTFSGVTTLQGSAEGITAALDIQGQDWKLANYGIRQVTVANAQFNGQTLALPSVQARGFMVALADQPQQFDAQLDFTGQLAADAIAGQLSLQGVALPQVQTALHLPIRLDGKVHAVAALSGTPAQPNLTGELHLDGVNVRDMAIQEAKVGFSYVDRQFHLESWQSLTEAESADAARSSR